MSKAAEITVYMVIGAIVACCLWVVGSVVHITLWYPDRIVSDKMWAMAGGAFTLLNALGMALIINVLSSSKQAQQVQSPQIK